VRRLLFALLAALAAAGLAASRGAAQASSARAGAPAAPADTAVWSLLSGAYTAAQARRGEAAFQENCGGCHTPVEFTGYGFQRGWAGRTVRDLFELVRSLMPFDRPGSLPRQVYADILAFLFERNGYPAGERELPADSAGLARVRIEALPEK